MKFDKKQLARWVETELSTLRYYGLREDRYLLNENSDIYKELRSIGYTKRPMTLMDRCIPATIKCDSEITTETSINDLYVVFERKSETTYSPCEIFMKLFPDRKKEIIDILKNPESNPKIDITI